MKITEVIKFNANCIQALYNRTKGCNLDGKITTKFDFSDDLSSAPIIFLIENQIVSSH
jgi:hypothetical protein